MLPNALYLRHMTNILITTTPTVENCPIRKYLGIVSGEVAISWESVHRVSWDSPQAALHEAQKQAIQQMAREAASLGANAVIGVRIGYKTISEPDKNVRVMMLIATGTAVRL